jgi:hypothetical protein
LHPPDLTRICYWNTAPIQNGVIGIEDFTPLRYAAAEGNITRNGADKSLADDVGDTAEAFAMQTIITRG